MKIIKHGLIGGKFMDRFVLSHTRRRSHNLFSLYNEILKKKNKMNGMKKCKKYKNSLKLIDIHVFFVFFHYFMFLFAKCH